MKQAKCWFQVFHSFKLCRAWVCKLCVGNQPHLVRGSWPHTTTTPCAPAQPSVPSSTLCRTSVTNNAADYCGALQHLLTSPRVRSKVLKVLNGPIYCLSPLLSLPLSSLPILFQPHWPWYSSHNQTCLCLRTFAFAVTAWTHFLSCPKLAPSLPSVSAQTSSQIGFPWPLI